jgi:hypothetical protein
MRMGLIAATALGLAACAPAAGDKPATEPAATAPAEAATANVDYTLERKPQPGDPASALIYDDKLVLSVFGDDGSISTATILLNPSAPPPPGMPQALGLEGEGWELHPVTVEAKAAKDRNGLCAGKDPQFVLKRKDADGAITLVGFTGANVTETDPKDRCDAYRFLP